MDELMSFNFRMINAATLSLCNLCTVPPHQNITMSV